MSKTPVTAASGAREAAKPADKADDFPNPRKGDVIVYGAPERGAGAQAAWFRAVDADVAARTAILLKLIPKTIATDEQALLAARLAIGELAGVSRRFAPPVAPQLFGSLSGAPWTEAPRLDEPLPKDPAKTWGDLRPGHIVLSHEEGPEDGWWQAVIVRISGDAAMLRWRFDPEMAAFTRPIQRLGLVQLG